MRQQSLSFEGENVMTLDLDRAEEIDKARTQGEWRQYGIYGKDYAEVFGPKPLLPDDNRIALGSHADGEFIAFCSTFVPAAIAEIRELRDRLSKAEDMLDGLAKRHEWSQHFTFPCICDYHVVWRQAKDKKC